MDFENFDEQVFNPEQTSLSRYLKAFSLLLVATFVIPIGRTGGESSSSVFVWDAFGVAATIDVIRWVLPAVLGLALFYLGFIARLSVKIRAGATAAVVLLMPLIGINPLAVFEVVIPPISGAKGERMLGMVEGAYFPREDLMHTIFLSVGLIGLGIGGRYRKLLNSSRIGSYIMMGASAFIIAYYTVPYAGEIPAMRNVELYTDMHDLADKMMNELRQLEEDAPREMLADPEMRRALKSAKFVGQIKLAAVYFLVIYFVPLLLMLTGIPAWFASRYQRHRIVFARLAGWGASIYLVAFLFPLLIKEGMRKTGPGFLPAFRDFILFAAIFVGLTLALSSFLRAVIDGDKNDDSLPADPLSWRENS